MFETILNLLFKEPKTMLELATEKIESSDKVTGLSANGTNPVNGKTFLVGSRKYNDRYSGSVRFDCLHIQFNRNDSEVMIKKDGEIIYFFNDSAEVIMVRDAIIKCYNNSQTKNVVNAP